MKVAGFKLNIEGVDMSLKSLEGIRTALREIKELTGDVGGKGVKELTNAMKQSSSATRRQKRELTELEKKEKELRDTRNRLRRETLALVDAGKQGTDEYQEKAKELGRLDAVMQEHRNLMRQEKAETQGQTDAYKKLSADLTAIRRDYKNLLVTKERNGKLNKEEQKDLDRLEKEYQQLDGQIKRVDAAAGQYGRNVGNYSSAVDGLSDSLFDAARVPPQVQRGLQGMGTVALGTGAAVAGLGAAAIGAFRQFAKLEDVMADVRKTTGLTEDEVTELKDRLFELNTRTSIEGLLAIAQGAGRLGVQGVDNLEQFTQAVDKVNVALGDDLGGDADQIATELGKIVNIFELDEEFGLAGGLERVGSIVNELAQTTKAQARPIIDFISRLQGIAAQTNISVDQLAAFGATLDELGQPVERSATALQRFISRIADAPERFADMAAEVGFARDEFLALTRSNPTEAILQVLEAGRSTKEGLEALKDVTEAFGITSERERGVILALSEGVDLLRENVEGSSKALEENTSIQDEFNVKNNTSQAGIDKLAKSWSRLVTSFGQEVAPALSTLVDMLTEVTQGATIFESTWARVFGGDGLFGAKLRERLTESFVGDATNRREVETSGMTWMEWFSHGMSMGSGASDAGDEAAKEFNKGFNDTLNNLFGEPEQAPFVKWWNEVKNKIDTDDGQSGTFKKLSERANVLKSEIEELAASNKDYTDELREYEQVQRRLNNINSIFNTDEVLIGIPKLKDEIANTRAELESGAFKGESFIKEKTDELIELEDRLEKAQRLLSIARQAAEFDPRSRVQPLENRELGADEDLVLEAITTDQEPLFGDPEFKISRDNLEKYKELSKEIHDDIAEYKVEKEKEAAELRKQINQELQQAAFSAAENAANSIFQIQRQMTEQRLNSELQAVEMRYNREIEAAELNAARQEELEAELEEKREEINQEAAERNKRIAITEALINAALAITQSLANTTLPFPASLAGPAAIAVATGAQIAAIRKQEFAEGGMIDGPSHAQGGVPFTVQGRPGFEAEGGEYLIRKEVIASNQRMNVSGTPKEIAEAINNSMGKYKANMPFTFQTGGSIPVPDSLTTIASANRGMNISETAMQRMTDSVTKAVVSGFERSKETIREGTREGLILGADTVNRNAERQANLSQNTQG